MSKTIREGRKTQTRRVVKWIFLAGASYYPDHQRLGNYHSGVPSSGWVLRSRGRLGCWEDRTFPMHSPYGQPGDILYVRENFYAYGYWLKMGRKWKFIDKTVHIGKSYQFTDNPPVEVQKKRRNGAAGIGWYLRPSIYMPREVSRVWLKNQDTNVERLQDTSEEDAKAEGIAERPSGFLNYQEGGFYNQLPKNSFRTLWELINGSESWNENPWVWAVTFKVLSTSGKPDFLPTKTSKS